MAIKAARGVSVFDRLGGRPVKNQVCKFWLMGRCKRNPCRFMHRELPPPQSEQSHSTPTADIHQHKSRKMTWRNPNYSTSKTVAISSNEGGILNRTSDQRASEKASENTERNSGDMDQEVVIASTGSDIQAEQEVSTIRADSGKSSVQEVQPKQCKYWITGNCVYGEKCKDLHSWFCGSGFTMLAKLGGHTKAITGISLPSGCDKLYTGGKDGSITAWDCHSGQCAGSVITDGEVGCLITEGPWLFVGLHNAVKAWNLTSHTEFSLNAPSGLVCCMVVDDDKLFAGTEDGTILVWKCNSETISSEPTATLKEHNGAVCSFVIGANRLYSGSRDCTIKAWDLQDLQCVQTLYGHTKDVMSVLCWDCYLLSASLDNTLKVWAATESGTIEVVYELKEDYGFSALCGIHDAEVKPILLCSCNDNTVRLYDLPSFTERGRIFSKREVQVIQIGIDGLFFTGDATGDISVWKLSQS
ncbi:U3 snoRNP-associated protein (contains WD40 repeats) [Handroanthus impetiginosus]|uniref:U3 snoRNP-associated protein (Contains WD40 repeats) n=1 Tax=Handroanthus impetiginosus TaxID=429701 RepID=A0A2G9GL46_9LAMI|nr:U3 snoRNP-associated protein (contains WD40 repeats) [Handroanthus impetiginosus]